MVLEEHGAHHGWVRFSFAWTPTQAGPVEIAARATDQQGIPQPFTVPFDVNGYQYAAVVRRPVAVVG